MTCAKRARSTWFTVLGVAAFTLAITLITPTALAEDNAGTGTCKYTRLWELKCRTTFFRAIITVGGIFGSTKSCKWREKTTYEYVGPPLEWDHLGHMSTAPNPTQSAGWQAQELQVFVGARRHQGFQPNPSYILRFLSGQAECYGDLIVPDTITTQDQLRYVGLDGQVFDLSFVPVTGSLAYFLGDGFDASPFHPDFLAYHGWTGVQAIVPESALIAPSLTLAVGGDPDVPVVGMMSLAQPDLKLLHVDLGPAAAFANLSLVVSDTSPGEGPLMTIDGVTIPIVPDAYTLAFDQMFPSLSVPADANGRADLAFPPLNDLSWEGVDLNVAVLAVDPSTGFAIASSTFIQIQLRDPNVCQ